jgi:DNA-binding NtrC family response regulator
MDGIFSKNTQDDSWRHVVAVGTHFTDGGSEDVPEQKMERRQGRPRSSQAIILVIDDDQTIRSLLHEALNLRGYQVTAVGTVQEAEDILQQRGAAALGLVITDIQLTANQQAREGYVLYQRWKASYPALPFLLISGDLSNQTLPAIRTGAVHFLPKPFTMSELLDTVHRLFRQ